MVDKMRMELRALMLVLSLLSATNADDKDLWLAEGRRPLIKNRKFNSTAINSIIAEYKPRFLDTNISTLFENCLPNTLDTTVEHNPETLDSFVITGDIHAMWLRDSTNQILPYLRFADKDPALQGYFSSKCALPANTLRLLE
jgi:hypothetical protein